MIDPYFSSGINSNVPPSSFLDENQMIKRVQDHFTSLERYTVEQKQLLSDRTVELIDEAKTNLGIKSIFNKQHKVEEKTVDQIITALDEMIVQVGSPLDLTKPGHLSSQIELVYDLLLAETPAVMKMLKDSTLLSAIFWEKNPEVIKEMKAVFQQIFLEINHQTSQKTFSDTEVKTIEKIVGNLLSYYAYFDPQDGETVKVPQVVNGEWKFIDYKIERLPLTPSYLGSPMVAFGLESPKESGLPPILLFKGTTYPTDDGFALSLLSDINPFSSVGGWAFNSGKETLEKWLQKATANSLCKAHVYGQSLGGALSLFAMTHFPTYVADGIAFEPPALTNEEMKEWNKGYELCKGMGIFNPTIYCQKGDIVSEVGRAWPKGSVVYKSLGPKEQLSGITSHAKCCPLNKENIILKIDPTIDRNRFKVKFLDFLHRTLSLPIFVIGCLFLLIHLGIQKFKDLILSLVRKPKTNPIKV